MLNDHADSSVAPATQTERADVLAAVPKRLPSNCPHASGRTGEHALLKAGGCLVRFCLRDHSV